MQPQQYERTTDFTERDGDDTNHSALNEELDAAALSINQVRDNLALIQRDDGALQNGIVTADALDPSAFDAVQASVNQATQEAQDAAASALVSATTANNAKDSAAASKASAETARDASLLNANNASTSAAAALASQTASAASEASALSSKNAAAASQTAAAASQTSASNSATTATAQAGISTTKAGESAASATNSANSAALSNTKANEAASSADSANTSKNAAAASASAAASSQASATNSASTATTQAGIATSKAAEAAASEAAALASKNAASASQTAAAASQTAAAASETSAAGSASTATSQAGIATTKASEAAASAVSAAASASSAAALLDNFDDRYLGAKATAPTVDNDGNPLMVGALYFDSTTGKMRVYTASGWLDASSASVATLAVFDYTLTAGQTTISGNDSNGVSLSYTVGAIVVSMNGAVLKRNDYTASNGSSIVLASPASSGSVQDELTVYAFGNFQVADTYSQAAADAKFLANTGGTLTGYLGINGTVASPKGVLITQTDTGSTLRVNFDNSAGLAQVGTFSNDPIRFLTNSTERVRVDNSGRVLTPYQPAFFAYRNNFSYMPTIWAAIDNYDGVAGSANRNSYFNQTTGRFTAPVNGMYQFNCTARSIDGATNNQITGVELWVNGSVYYGNDQWASSGASYGGTIRATCSASFAIELSANDYVQFAITGSIYHAYFSGCLLG